MQSFELRHAVSRPTADNGPVLAPWRLRKHDAAALEQLREEQKAEENLFQRILAEATKAEVPLAGLYELTLEFCGSPEDERRTLAKKLAKDALAWRNAFDDDGNPLWISLAPCERQKENSEPESALPDEAENAAPKGGLRLDDNGGKGKKKIPTRENLLFNALDALVRRISGTPRQKAFLPRTLHAGSVALPPPKRQMLTGCVRMFALGVCLAVIYHALTLKGWVPRLF